MTTTTQKTEMLTLWAANDVTREYELPLMLLVADYITSGIEDNGDFSFSFIYYVSRYGSFGKLTDEQWRAVDQLHKKLKAAYVLLCEDDVNSISEAVKYVTKSYSVVEIQAVMESRRNELNNDTVFFFLTPFRALQNIFETKCITLSGKIA